VFEQCPVALKRSLEVWGDVGESLAIMRQMKEQYDRGRVLNPGRFVGGI
jgi:glycolate oxidase FAD binding subunit